MSKDELGRMVRRLLVTLAILIGVIAGQIGGILVAAGGAKVSEAFIAGGVTFASTVTLVLLIQKSLNAI